MAATARSGFEDSYAQAVSVAATPNEGEVRNQAPGGRAAPAHHVPWASTLWGMTQFIVHDRKNGVTCQLVTTKKMLLLKLHTTSI